MHVANPFPRNRRVVKVKTQGIGVRRDRLGGAARRVADLPRIGKDRPSLDFFAADKMVAPEHQQPDDVDQLLRNAQLRDEIEPLLDDSIAWLQSERLPVSVENEFLESMLQWERAPILPISQWFEPEIILPSPESLNDQQLREILYETIHRLFRKRIVLDFTDHLSDRELYCLILRDILPAQEKKIDRRGSYLHWDCSDSEGDPEIWLRYYATEEERALWAEDLHDPLPPQEEPPYPRELPRAPM